MLKFLADENLRLEIELFLKERGYDVRRPPAGSSDDKIAELAKKEGRILVSAGRITGHHCCTHTAAFS